MELTTQFGPKLEVTKTPAGIKVELKSRSALDLPLSIPGFLAYTHARVVAEELLSLADEQEAEVNG